MSLEGLTSLLFSKAGTLARRKKFQIKLEPTGAVGVSSRTLQPRRAEAAQLFIGKGQASKMGKPVEAGSESTVQQGMRDMRHRKEMLPEIDSELQAHIGRHLKAAYEDILNQPVPDRFRQLLGELGHVEGDAGSGQEEGRNDGKVLRS